jgi:PKD repeat protein
MIVTTIGTYSPPAVNYGAPVAAFTVPYTSLYVGQSLQFTDTSTGAPTDWVWTVNGTIFSYAQNPSYYFNSTGGFGIVLTASNQYGSSTYGTTITVYAIPQGGQGGGGGGGFGLGGALP